MTAPKRELTVGFQLEEMCAYALSREYKRDFVSLLDTRADTEEGTDFELYGIPCDVTTNFWGKSFMDILPESYMLTLRQGVSIEVKFGVRKGNSHKGFTAFKKPVLVVGFMLDNSTFRTWQDVLENAIKKYASDMMEFGQSLFWDWCDETGFDF